jgi:hypothetical protein
MEEVIKKLPCQITKPLFKLKIIIKNRFKVGSTFGDS